MKKYKVVFIKVVRVLGPEQQIVHLAEQVFQSESDKMRIITPDGYGILSVTEYLPDVIIEKDEKETIS